MVTLKIKIYNIEKCMDIFIIDNEHFNYDFLIGLDCIINFKLMQNEKLKIIQYNDQEKKKLTSNEEDKNNNNYKENDTSNLENNKIPDVLVNKMKKQV